MSEHATETGSITKTVTVERRVEDAFRLFTEGIASWWPLETHSVAQKRAAAAVFESGVGGRIFERTEGGEEALWGTVLVWEPPRRIICSWHPGRGEETRQEIEVRFTPEADATRIDLEHRGWERYGDGVTEMMRDYDTGWDYVLGECYAGAAA